LAILDKFSLSDPDNMSDDKKKTLFAIVKPNAVADFVKWEGKKIGKLERVEVTPELKKQVNLAPLLDFFD